MRERTISERLISRLENFARSILPDPLVRTLAALAKFRFPGGRPNAVLISIVLSKNVLAALWNFRSFRESNRAIERYRGSLRGLASQSTGQNVKVLHLIYGLKQHEPFYHFHWALIERMISTIKPDRVFFHYTYESEGVYWEKIKKQVCTVQVPPFEYYGVARLKHFAHKADVVRLLALYEMGGLYLDIDTLIFKSFDDLFSAGQLVLGTERWHGRAEPRGLCNAVLLAPRNHGGVRAWLQSYNYFRGKGVKLERYWAEHSVRLPLMWLPLREDVKVLDSHSFFEINGDETNLFFDSNQAAQVEARVAGAYSLHLWETFCMANLLADFKVAAPANESFLGAQLGGVSSEP
jgi:hypothetical protein